MTDIRYQQALNSLVKPNRRQVLDPATSKPPVTGGTGYAAGSPPQQIAEDKVFMSTAFSVHLAGEPDIAIPQQKVLDLNSEPLYIAVTGGDIYTVHRALGLNRTIERNGQSFMPNAFSNIGGFSSNTTMLVVAEAFDVSTPWEIQFYDLDGGLIRKFTETAPWQIIGLSPRTVRANDTRWAVGIQNNTDWNDRQGFYFYDLADDSQILFQAEPHGGNQITRADTAFMPDRMYSIWSDVTRMAYLTVYDLAGNQLDTQVIDTSTWHNNNGYNWVDVTHAGMWFGYGANQQNFLSWLPRIDASELFDDTARLTVEINPGNNNLFNFFSKDRDFTLEY